MSSTLLFFSIGKYNSWCKCTPLQNHKEEGKVLKPSWKESGLSEASQVLFRSPFSFLLKLPYNRASPTEKASP